MSACRGLVVTAVLAAANAAAAGSLPPAPAGVSVTTEYGIEFVTIGDPGNRPTRIDEQMYNPVWSIGAVPYEYRMARTEVTIGQWLEFVRAYDQFNDPPRVSNAFSGHGIEWDFAGQQWYATRPLSFPTTMSWEYAARYCNWLTNDKAMTADAFERGAYDASTFTRNPDGSYNHQAAHSPGARFWIPTHDEWVKSVHWDPDKNNGEGGYWYYPNASDLALVPGLETNAGEGGIELPVDRFPGVQTPWGLLGASGGAREWCETIEPVSERFRFVRGSYAGQDTYFLFDAIDLPTYAAPTGWLNTGLRLASIPSNGVELLFLGLWLQTQKRRRVL